MAIDRNTRYPGRFDAPTTARPQGAFKNRSAPGAKDGSYLERDWANDWDGFFGSLLRSAGMTPNGTPDTALASQYFDALSSLGLRQATEDSIGVAAIATNGDMATQSNDTKIVTPQKLTSWFNTKLASYLDKGITSFATSGEVITGEAEDKSVSPATIRFGFQVLKAQTGYIKFPNWLGGLIVQWTKTPVLGITVPYTWAYPIQFPNMVSGTFGMFIGFSQGTLEVTETPTLTNSRFANGLAGSTAGPAFVFAWGF